MAFDINKYTIIHDYIEYGNARSGKSIIGPRFGVAHDTGNPGSTARGNRNYFNRSQPSASAHTFIDDEEIVNMIPLNEKAWHNLYGNPEDNLMFGDDANDAAIGVELCYGGRINFNEAYKRYVWYWAYLCHKFGWEPDKEIVAHATLDPRRRTDPHNALNQYGITYDQFIEDVKTELKGDGVTMEEFKKLLQELRELPVSDWAEDDWDEVKANGYFDGTGPQGLITRQEAGIVVNRIRHNIKDYVQEEIQKALEEHLNERH